MIIHNPLICSGRRVSVPVGLWMGRDVQHARRGQHRCVRIFTISVDTCHSLSSRHASVIDAVIISHPDLAHVGALPYAYAKLGSLEYFSLQ